MFDNLVPRENDSKFRHLIIRMNSYYEFRFSQLNESTSVEMTGNDTALSAE